MTRREVLRYGENPHQQGAFYTYDSVRTPVEGIGGFEQHHGKGMSYVNILDADAAYNAVADFEEPAISIIKHTNPACFAAGDASLTALYERALKDGDFVSAYGGIVAVNRVVDMEFASALREVRSPTDGETRMFYEIVVAPGYEPDALEHLKKKSKDLRILTAPMGEPRRARLEYRSVRGWRPRAGRGREVRDGLRGGERAEALGGRARRHAGRLEHLQAREVERRGVREGRRAHRYGRRPAEPRRLGSTLRGAGRGARPGRRLRYGRVPAVPRHRGGRCSRRVHAGGAHRRFDP
jgi:hypothetical protein